MSCTSKRGLTDIFILLRRNIRMMMYQHFRNLNVILIKDIW